METLFNKPRNEEELVMQADLAAANTKKISAYETLPYNLIQSEIVGSSKVFQQELNEIMEYYEIYHKGTSFVLEGTNGDYVAADLKYKLAAQLINKQARFLFSKSPDIVINAKSEIGKATPEMQRQLTIYNDLIKTVLDKNMFEKDIIQAARDCFIGKRVACLVNFNDEDGITVNFFPSTNFIYEYKFGSKHVLQKFVVFIDIEKATLKKDNRIFKKKYTLEVDANGKNNIYLEETIVDGLGQLVEVLVDHEKTALENIPAVVITNDGLIGDIDGESEIEVLKDYESWYSKLANSDKDAERKSMNPVRFTVDMEGRSTKNLSSSAGSYWDLQSNQNLDKPSPQVGLLESNMAYSDTLKTTLDRLKSTAYEQVDVPYISLETMSGAITSGKSLKAIYWPLIIRCQEKMKTWGPMLRRIVDIIIEGAFAYPDVAALHINDKMVNIMYEVEVINNTPLPEDEMDEKTIDMAEVNSKIMSRKAYMKKWYQLTDDEVDEELIQISNENQLIEETFGGMYRMSDFSSKMANETIVKEIDEDTYSEDVRITPDKLNGI